MAFEDLSKYDFSETVTRLEEYLSNQTEWLSLLSTSTTKALIEMYAWVVNSLKYNNEATLKDVLFGTTESLQALLSHIQITGYQPQRNVSSKMEVRFKVANPLSISVTIPKNTRIKVSDLYFVTIQDAVLVPGSTSVDIDVIQGYKLNYEFSSTGVENYQIDIIESNDIENENVEVLVNSIKWNPITSFIDQSANSEVYQVSSIYSGIRITFGDGIFGKKVPINAIINVSVLISKGESGNITSTGLSGIVIDIINASDGSVVNFSVETLTEAIGGKNAQTLKEIKQAVPPFITSGGVYKRESELKQIFEGYNQIDQVNIYTEAMKPELDRQMEKANIINVYIVVATGYILNFATKQLILNDLISEEKLLLTTTYNLEEAEYIYLRQDIDITVPIGVSITKKENEVLERVTIFYNTFKFGDDILQHLIERALIEFTDDNGQTYQRDTDIYNLRNVTKIVILQSQFELWYGAEYQSDIVYEEILVNGAFTQDTSEDAYWQSHRNEGTLKKIPITSFIVEIGGEEVINLTSGGDFIDEKVQGSINFITGNYSITVSDDVTEPVILLYTYTDIDILLEPNEYPKLYDTKIDAVVGGS